MKRIAISTLSNVSDGLGVAETVAVAERFSFGLSLMIITLSPAIVVVGYEVLGARHEAAVLQRVLR